MEARADSSNQAALKVVAVIVRTTPSFKPTLRFLEGQLPKWTWIEARESNNKVLADLKARGLPIDSAVMRLGSRALSKRTRAHSYTVVDPWSRRVFYACSHSVANTLTTTDRWKWEPNNRDMFMHILRLCGEAHQCSKHAVLLHLNAKAEVARRETLITQHEARHGALGPLERLRIRYGEA